MIKQKQKKQFYAGITLIEMILTIVIISVVSPMLLLFLKTPFDALLITIDRNKNTQELRVLLSQLKIEMRAPLPNSVKVFEQNGRKYLQFIPLKGQGLYRVAQDVSGITSCSDNTPVGAPDALAFGQEDTCLVTAGSWFTEGGAQGGDWIVVFPLGELVPDSYIYNQPMHTQNIQSKVLSVTTRLNGEGVINFEPIQFKNQSDSQKFFIVNRSIIYEFSPSEKTIKRYTGTTWDSNIVLTNTPEVVAKNIDDVQFYYSELGVGGQLALLEVAVKKEIAQKETITVYGAIHANNSP